MGMTPAELKESMDFFGQNQNEFAAWLGVSTRTVRRWLKGEAQVYDPVALIIRQARIIRQQHDLIDKQAEQIDAFKSAVANL